MNKFEFTKSADPSTYFSFNPDEEMFEWVSGGDCVMKMVRRGDDHFLVIKLSKMGEIPEIMRLAMESMK